MYSIWYDGSEEADYTEFYKNKESAYVALADLLIKYWDEHIDEEKLPCPIDSWPKEWWNDDHPEVKEFCDKVEKAAEEWESFRNGNYGDIEKEGAGLIKWNYWSFHIKANAEIEELSLKDITGFWEAYRNPDEGMKVAKSLDRKLRDRRKGKTK